MVTAMKETDTNRLKKLAQRRNPLTGVITLKKFSDGGKNHRWALMAKKPSIGSIPITD
jgi:hypothetical protein